MVEGTSIAGTEHSVLSSLFTPGATDWVTEAGNPNAAPALCPTVPFLEVPRECFGTQAKLLMA